MRGLGFFYVRTMIDSASRRYDGGTKLPCNIRRRNYCPPHARKQSAAAVTSLALLFPQPFSGEVFPPPTIAVVGQTRQLTKRSTRYIKTVSQHRQRHQESKRQNFSLKQHPELPPLPLPCLIIINCITSDPGGDTKTIA